MFEKFSVANFPQNTQLPTMRNCWYFNFKELQCKFRYNQFESSKIIGLGAIGTKPRDGKTLSWRVWNRLRLWKFYQLQYKEIFIRITENSFVLQVEKSLKPEMHFVREYLKNLCNLRIYSKTELFAKYFPCNLRVHTKTLLNVKIFKFL